MSVAVSSAALAIAAQAEREAHEARCTATVAAFDSHTASVQQQQAYSECVMYLHPNPITGPEIIFIKVIIVCALLGMTYGAINPFSGDEELGDRILSGLLGVFMGGLAPVVVAGLCIAILYLFT